MPRAKPSGAPASRPSFGARGLASMISLLALGCGSVNCGKAPPGHPEAGGGEPVAQAAAEAPSSETGATQEDEVLPAYNDEALAARVEAQRALLGDDLFEDLEGNPVAPRIDMPDEDEDEGEGEGEDGSGDPQGSLEDDILLALPGSAGFGPDGALAGGNEKSAANGNALGLYVPIEDPRNAEALAHFHQALRDLAAGQDEDGKVRILVYGGSHTQADVYPGYFRAYLQTRFGEGGMGFVALDKVNRWYRYQDWYIDETKSWTSEWAQRSSARKDGYYGLLGASGSATKKHQRTKIVPRHDDSVAGRYELYYLAQPEGGRLRLYADGKKIATVDTAEHEGEKVTAPRAGYHAFSLPEGPHEVEVRVVGDGEVRLFGLTMEREQPGVVVDTLGISGTRAANFLKWDQEVWTDNVQRRDPDLYTLFYGTNEATDTNQPMSDYRANLREVLERLRTAAPEASCLLIGPGDFPREVEEDVWVPRPRLVEIVEAQRDIAYEMGCGFWDTLAFMGGVNSMHEWATARPRMASRDHIHFTKRGYVRLGMAVIDAMMAGFDRE